MSLSEKTREARGSARVRLERSVRLRYRLFQEFIEEVSSNISVGGMFIATDEPQETGAHFDFEMILEDGFPLIKGKGEVVWIRHSAGGPDRPAGMGVRFLELEGSSRKLIETIVEKTRKEGAATFDLERDSPLEVDAPTGSESVIGGESTVDSGVLSIPDLADLIESVGAAAASEAAVGEVRTHEQDDFRARRDPEGPTRPGTRFEAFHVPEPEPEPMSGLMRVTLLGLAAIVAGLGLVWAVDLLYVGPQIEDVELAGTGTALSRHPVSSSGIGVGSGEESQLADTAAAVQAPLGPMEPLETLQEWARAWSEKRVDDYLGFYASGYEPSVAGGRAGWEALRRERVERHQGIDVQVLLAEETRVATDEAVVTFVQTYSADGYEDRVRKMVRLVRENGDWRILEEDVVRALPD